MAKGKIKIRCEGATSIDLQELTAFQGELKKLTRDNFRKLRKEILELGFSEPISVWKSAGTNYVLNGHQRLLILKELKKEGYAIPKLPVSLVQAKDYKDAKRKVLAMASQYGRANMKGLQGFIEDTDITIEEVSDSFSFGEIDDKVANMVAGIVAAGKKDENDIPKAPSKPSSKAGDIYRLGEHRLTCGDSTKPQVLEAVIKGEKAKLCFTSPPYNMAGALYKNYTDDLKGKEYIDLNLAVIKNVVGHLAGFLFWNLSYNKNACWEWIEIYYRIIKETGLMFLENIVWDKGKAMPVVGKGGLTRQYENILAMGTAEDVAQDLELCFLGTNQKAHYFNKKALRGVSNYWRITTMDSQTDDNKACFPVALPVQAMLLMTQRDDLVLDPFAGSGTTLIAAEKIGRRCVAIEMAPAQVDQIIQRWEEYTDKKSEKLSGSR